MRGRLGATHWDCETFRYRKDGYIYLYITGYWADGITGDSYYDYDDIIKIDFAPLDDYYTDKELDIVAAGGDTELEVARIITVPQDASWLRIRQPYTRIPDALV